MLNNKKSFNMLAKRTLVFTILIIMTFSVSAHSNREFSFTEVPSFMDGRWYGESDFGDYDNDGDLDILVTGYGMTSGAGNINLYRNDGDNNFTDVYTPFAGIGNGTCSWIDYDNDGDLDVFLSGQKAIDFYISKFYENEDGSFTEITTDILPLTSSSSDWGDYDNDGYQDLLLTGSLDTKGAKDIAHTVIYRNLGDGNFQQIDPGIIDIEDGDAKWGDYDNDGDLDIAVSGRVGSFDYQTQIYRNDGDNNFTNIMLDLAHVRYSRLDWGDYDADGDIDLIVTGSRDNSEPSVTNIYRNDGDDTFVNINADILGVRQGDMVWGDLHNSGYLDVMMNGLYTTTQYCGHVYYYHAGSYSLEDSLVGLKYTDLELGDYNADNNLDFVITGRYSYQDYKAKLYENQMSAENTQPFPPTTVTTDIVDSTVTISWDAGSDNETPAAGLSYNLWLGTASETDDIISANADLTNGYRRIAKRGNMGSKLEYTFPSLPDGTYYCAVQSIDNSYISSDFTDEVQFEVTSFSTDDNQTQNFTKLNNYPNPFKTTTNINFSLKSAEKVQLEIYNVKGQLVNTLVDDNLLADDYSVSWNRKDAKGKLVTSGIYFYRLTNGKTSQTEKMIVIE
ncbi:MAG: T9SS type A sorting domain-containing protein [Candidatus Cloacimonetes bacterium]|nr:T9SS type A sorting domain-containing protein [Candidatus Cloacimonadota bacterium]